MKPNFLVTTLIAMVTITGCASAYAKSADNANDANYQQVSRTAVLAQNQIPVYTYKIVARYPHDTSAYTEGLLLENNALYESTGLYGHSKLRKLDLATGKVLKEDVLPQQYFAEGTTILGNDFTLELG